MEVRLRTPISARGRITESRWYRIQGLTNKSKCQEKCQQRESRQRHRGWIETGQFGSQHVFGPRRTQLGHFNAKKGGPHHQCQSSTKGQAHAKQVTIGDGTIRCEEKAHSKVSETWYVPHRHVSTQSMCLYNDVCDKYSESCVRMYKYMSFVSFAGYQ